MEKEEIINQTLEIQRVFITDDIENLCRAKKYIIKINYAGEPIAIMKAASGDEDEEERKMLIKCAEHLYSLNPELILWVWQNEKSCLAME